MKFVHQREHLNEDDIAVIKCSQQCNIHLMSDANFHDFKNGGWHSYHGDVSDHLSTKIKVPSTGLQNITIDTVTRRPVSMTRRPNFKWPIKFIYRSGSQFI